MTTAKKKAELAEINAAINALDWDPPLHECLRRCICADPENCTEPIVGALCRRGEAGWKQTVMLNEALLKECRWSIDDHGGDSVYETQCGHSFEFTNDGVEENGFKFCAYCGGRLVESRSSEGDE